MSQKTATEWFDEGNAFKSKNKFLEALISLNQAIFLQTDYHRAYDAKAFCLMKLNQLDKAVEALDKAIQYAPEVQYFVNKAILLRKLKKTNEALRCLEEAISKHPTSPDAHSEKGNLLNRMERRNEALECYKETVRIRPDHKGFHNLGSVYYSMKNYNDAIKQFDEAIRLNLDSALSLCWRGNCYLALDKKEDALRDFTKAQKLGQSEQVDKVYSPDNLKYIKKTLESVIELNNMVESTRNLLKDSKNFNPFLERLKSHIEINIQAMETKNAHALLNLDYKQDSLDEAKSRAEIDKLRNENNELIRQLKIMNDRLNTLEQKQERIEERVDNIDQDFEVI